MVPVSSQMPAMSLTEPLGLAGYAPPAATGSSLVGRHHRPDTEGDETVLEASSRGVVADRHPTFAVRDRTADRRAAHRPSQPDRHEGSTCNVTQRHSKRPSAFSVSVTERGSPMGPGNRPAFTRTWKPLQMPSIGRDACGSRKLVGEPGAQLERQTTTGTECVAVAETPAGGSRRGRRSALRRCAAR